MQVNNVSSINFESAKKRFISQEMQANSQKLLEMMNNGTKYTENNHGTSFTSYILASLSMGKKVRFIDNRFYLFPTEGKIKDIPDCTLKIGKKFINFNSESGEIFKYETGTFTSLRSLLSKAEKYIDDLVTNFDKPEVVSKNRFGIKGFTKKGFENFSKYM